MKERYVPRFGGDKRTILLRRSFVVIQSDMLN